MNIIVFYLYYWLFLCSLQYKGFQMENPTSGNTLNGLVRAGASAALGQADWQIAMATGVVSALLYSTWIIYQKITEDKPLSEADKIRHAHLKKAFEKHFPGCGIPDIWALDEKEKPQPMPSFASIMQEAYENPTLSNYNKNKL